MPVGAGEGGGASSTTPTFSIIDISAADLEEDDMDGNTFADGLTDRSKAPTAERRTAFDTAPLHAAIAAIETDARAVLDRKTACVIFWGHCRFGLGSRTFHLLDS